MFDENSSRFVYPGQHFKSSQCRAQPMTTTVPAVLALADGTIFRGHSIGAKGNTTGEVVFNTALTGYQEVLTDPSYTGQIVTMTYPLIGNYGTTAEDQESHAVQVEGFVVRELTRIPSNFRSHRDLDTYLRASNVTGIEGIDTRSLVRRLRTRGAMTGLLSSIDHDDESLRAKVRACPGLVGRDMIREVLPDAKYEWKEGLSVLARSDQPVAAALAKAPHVVAIDYGMKWNIPRHLYDLGCQVTVLPGTASAADVLACEPDGVFLSNGPGDPEPVGYAIEAIRKLIGKVPVFGICLGHQLCGLALGGKTYKLKFGHHGSNHPVKNLLTGQVEITAQNHGFAVDPESLPSSDVEITHVNLNDHTNEGMRHRSLPLFSVQYHPEASPGPHDSHYLFRQFTEMMRATKNPRTSKRSASQKSS